jgi:hypothetical protein
VLYKKELYYNHWLGNNTRENAMNLEQWMQLVFGAAILGVTGFLGTQLFDMKGVLSQVSTKVESTDSRVSRIADTLPEVKARIAWEEVNRPITGLIISTNPKQVEGTKWATSVKLYDAAKGVAKTYTLVLDARHKHHLRYVVAGHLRDTDAYAPSFQELASFSGDLKELVTFPTSIDVKTSYALRLNNIGEHFRYLEQITEQKPIVSKVPVIKNWKDLVAKLGQVEKRPTHESDAAEAMKHAKVAVSEGQRGTAKAVSEHAQEALKHAEMAQKAEPDPYVAEAEKALKEAIEHGNMGHADVASQAAENALSHLKMAYKDREIKVKRVILQSLVRNVRRQESESTGDVEVKRDN